MGLTESRWSIKIIILIMNKSFELLPPTPICLMRQTKPDFVWGSDHFVANNQREFFSPVFLRGGVWLSLFSMAGHVLVIPSLWRSNTPRFFSPQPLPLSW